MHWVHILQNPSGRFYVGQTNDLLSSLLRAPAKLTNTEEQRAENTLHIIRS
jgi:hypothetical protein